MSPSTPLLVKKVEYSTSKNARMLRYTVEKRAVGSFLFRLMSSKCAAATSTIHGTRDEFSTGSQAQNPPKLRASYAQAPPIKMPAPKMPTAKNAQGNTGLIQLVKSLLHSAPMA